MQIQRVLSLAEKTAEKLDAPGLVGALDIEVNCDYIGEGYDIPTPGMIDAITLAARLEGLLFDPVYSGKALDGMIDLARQGHFDKDETIVFLHTGGSPGLFGYVNTFTS